MREMTKEQEAFLVHLNSDEFREAARKNEEAHEAAMGAARATAAANLARYRAEEERKEREMAEAIRPLMEALRAAGIKLELSSYEGVWGSYQIGNGPVVSIDLDSFDAGFDRDEEDEC